MANLKKDHKGNIELFDESTVRFSHNPDYYEKGDTITITLSDGSQAIWKCTLKKT